MTSRGPVLATALVAVVAAVMLWLAFGTGDESGAAVAPGAAEERGGALVAPIDEAEPTGSQPDPEPQQDPVGEERTAVPPWSARFRARAVDRLTGDGVPRLLVRIKTTGAASRFDLALTDDHGWFESPVPYEPARLELAASDTLHDRVDQGLERRTWDHGPKAAELTWRITTGPCFRPNVIGGPEDLEWKALLYEVRGNEMRSWSWIDVDTSEGWPAWIRYEEIEHAPEAGWQPWLNVTDAAERWSGKVALPSSVGQHPDPVAIGVQAVAGGVQGTVIDTDGEPVPAHVLLLLERPWRGHTWLEAGTQDDGYFEIERSPGGEHRLLVQTDHRPIARYDVEVAPGRVTSLDIVVATVDIAGNITGSLVGPTTGGEPLAFMELEGLDGGATSLVQLAGFVLFSDPDGAGRSEFAFEDLPAGRYEVRVSPMDGRRYDRLAAEVRVPAENLLFTTDDVVQKKGAVYVLRVVDAPTGELLPEISLLWRLGPMWSSEIETSPGYMIESGPSMPDLVGVVSAPGYVPRAFVARDFEPDGDVLTRAFADRESESDVDVLSMELPLERGHGAAVVVLDAEHLFGGSEARFDDYLTAKGVAGARVVSRGRTLGKSDASGLALVRAPQPVDAFEVRAPGWVELTRLHFQDLSRSPGGAGFVLMVRE